MAKSIVVTPKKRGRPSTGGRDPLVGVRFPPDIIAAVDQEAAARDMTRSDIIREHVTEGVRHILKKKAKGGKR
ncbi:MAG: CopG family transcriptional regulator [Reyranella sp.]|nr:CopG family transcriptional regulator [Reyranella sp.]